MKKRDQSKPSPERLYDDVRVVSPKVAQAILDEGHDKFYAKTIHELETYLDGNSRKITLRSIRARQERLLAEQQGAAGGRAA